MKILTDHNISPKVARAIDALIRDGDSLACALREKFPASTPDIDWITALGKEGGWTVISADLHIRKNKAERFAWMRTDLIGFFMEPGLARLPPVEQTARLLMRLPSIQEQTRLVSGPAMFSLALGANSRFKQIH